MLAARSPWFLMTEPGLREPRADVSALRPSVPHDEEPLSRAAVCETHTATLFFVGDRA